MTQPYLTTGDFERGHAITWSATLHGQPLTGTVREVRKDVLLVAMDGGVEREICPAWCDRIRNTSTGKEYVRSPRDMQRTHKIREFKARTIVAARLDTYRIHKAAVARREKQETRNQEETPSMSTRTCQDCQKPLPEDADMRTKRCKACIAEKARVDARKRYEAQKGTKPAANKHAAGGTPPAVEGSGESQTPRPPEAQTAVVLRTARPRKAAAVAVPAEPCNTGATGILGMVDGLIAVLERKLAAARAFRAEMEE